MKILLLANSASAHTQKWALGLAGCGIEVGIFSLNISSEEWYQNQKLITILYEPQKEVNNDSLGDKISYLFKIKKVKEKISQFKPDVLHSHYATSYGLLGMRSKFKPFVISVWGSDVYDFPKISVVNALLLKKIFRSVNQICSTSNCMKLVTQNYTDKHIYVVPFGVNTNEFTSMPLSNLNGEEITIGIIKSLEPKYGIDVLIQAFALVKKTIKNKKLKLKIVGGGSKRDEYELLADTLGLSEDVYFTGKIPNAEVINVLQQIDVFASLSILDSESFGVSLVEAMAAGKTIVVSDVDGFKEVIGNENCGIIVKRKSIQEAANAIIELINNPEKAREYAANARKRAIERYEWKDNLNQMISIYNSIINETEK